MAYSLGSKSRENLEGVHPDLVRVVKRAIELTTQDFSVFEGVRSLERQKKLVAQGKSQTLDSRHITGHAVDLLPYPITWDWDYYFPIADAMIKASHELGIPLRWGGNWRVKDLRKWHGTAKHLNSKYPGKFPDGPHFELPKRYYP